MMVRKSKGLSEKHIKILDLLQKYSDNEGYPPSIREIGEQTGISSTSVVNYYLEQLKKWGYIERSPHISRGLRVVPEMLQTLGDMLERSVEAAGDLFNIPVIGRIGASLPLPTPSSDFSFYDPETGIQVARSMLPVKKDDKLYALEVEGNSMIDAMVNDGDIVIMRKVDNKSEVKNGDMVAVWLTGKDEVTLKYFYKEKDGYRLQPANPTMAPIMIDQKEPLEISGKVVMVIRKVAGMVM